MQRILNKTLAWLGLALGTALTAPTAGAQGYPERPIRLIVPYSAGGVTDQYGRTVAESLSKRLGQPVLVENKTGANGTLGAVQMLNTDPAG